MGDQIVNCEAGGTIASYSSYAYAGGITAYTAGGPYIYRCKFTGAIGPYGSASLNYNPSGNYAGTYFSCGPIAGYQGGGGNWGGIECEYDPTGFIEATPAASYSLAERLTGLAAEARYTVNGAAKTADASGTIPMDESWFGTAIAIVKKNGGIIFNAGGANTTADSAPQSLAIPARPAAPAGLTAGAGTLSGTTAAVERLRHPRLGHGLDCLRRGEHKRHACGQLQCAV
jgi:hypothetical protein